MAGDVQEPYSLSFQVNSLHSGSVSFGRFEVESLSWERRSSFSHNRYLEEVEKYARPGSVTEMKAYFEAHFRRKALLRQASSESQVEKDGFVDEDDSYRSTCEESNPHDDENGDVCHLGECLEGSCYEGGSKEAEEEVGSTSDAHESHMESLSNLAQMDIVDKLYLEGGESQEKAMVNAHSEWQSLPALDGVDHVEKSGECSDTKQTFENGCEQGYDLSTNLDQHDARVEMKPDDEVQDVSKEENIYVSHQAPGSGLETLQTNPPELRTKDMIRSRHEGRVSLANKLEVRKQIAQTVGCRERQIPLTTTQKQMSTSVGSSLQSSLRISKKESPPSMKAKTRQEIRSEKEVRPVPKRSVTVRPSTAETTENRGHKFAARRKEGATTNKEIKRCAMNFSFRRDGAERSREEKKEEEIRQVGRSHNPKVKPMTSIYHDTVPSRLNGYKSRVIPSSSTLAKAPCKSLHLGNPPVASGSMPCSRKGDNQAISPSSRSDGSRVSFGRRNCDVDKNVKAHGLSSNRNKTITASQRSEVSHKTEDNRKETERTKQRFTECRQMNKGRTTEVRRKEGMGSSSNAILRKSFGHSSAVGHLTVGVAS